ncbi:hypothetical protein DFH09DRAFT_1086887 [Mycena vulgaris]|nr:hypothetical protein DFH09DRAFT_1086887 [Mycena vulgaris]
MAGTADNPQRLPERGMQNSMPGGGRHRDGQSEEEDEEGREGQDGQIASMGEKRTNDKKSGKCDGEKDTGSRYDRIESRGAEETCTRRMAHGWGTRRMRGPAREHRRGIGHDRDMRPTNAQGCGRKKPGNERKRARIGGSDARHRALSRASAARRSAHSRPLRRGADTTKALDARRLNPDIFLIGAAPALALSHPHAPDGFGASGPVPSSSESGSAAAAGELRFRAWTATSMSSSEAQEERAAGGRAASSSEEEESRSVRRPMTSRYIMTRSAASDRHPAASRKFNFFFELHTCETNEMI